jgi:hypothetical protein
MGARRQPVKFFKWECPVCREPMEGRKYDHVTCEVCGHIEETPDEGVGVEVEWRQKC